MKLLIALCILQCAINCRAQALEERVDRLELLLNEVRQGKANFTGRPIIRDAIEWSDGTVQVSSPPAAGRFIQWTSSVTSAYFQGVGTIPYDDTIPQQTEGFKVLTATITATSAANNFRVTARVCATEPSNSGDQAAICVFLDGGANAIGCSSGPMAADIAPCRNFAVDFTTPTLNTSQHVFSVRMGMNTGNLDINGAGGARVYGGALTSTLDIFEISN